MKISKIIPLLFLLFNLLNAADISSSISSKRAAYDGEALVLSDNVKLNHALGILQANNARLEKEEKDLLFSKIHLDDDVCITLTNHGKIFCSMADFDLDALSGEIFSNIFFSNNEKLSPLSISSERAQVKLGKDDGKLILEELAAVGNVSVGYGEGFTLTTSLAKYIQTDRESFLFAPFPSTLSHFNDEMTATQIAFYPRSSQLTLEEPEGKLSVSFLPKNNPMHFSCQNLIWDEVNHSLVLEKDVILTQEGFGTLTCDEKVQIKHENVKGKWTLKSVKTTGKTKWEHLFDDGIAQQLICYGPVHLNQNKSILTLESPNKIEQIEYFHDNLKLNADSLKMKYLQVAKKIHPRSILLKGNVYLSNKDDFDNVRCAIADEFSYRPDSQTIILRAKERQKVLFYDEEQDLSISAAEVHITKGAKADRIRGVGNVRLTFSSTENALLKKLFPFYRSDGG